MKIKILFLSLTLVIFSGCTYKTIENKKMDVVDTDCTDAKTYCESLLTKDSEGRIQVDYKIMEESFYKDTSCDNWSIKCNWYPMD